MAIGAGKSIGNACAIQGFHHNIFPEEVTTTSPETQAPDTDAGQDQDVENVWTTEERNVHISTKAMVPNTEVQVIFNRNHTT